MRLTETLAAFLEDVTAGMDLPPIARVVMPERASNPCKDADFGLVALTDESVGFFYAWLGEVELGGRSPAELVGEDPRQLLGDLSHPILARRALALGGFNAIGQCVLKQVGYPLPAADSLGAMRFEPGDHVGMVGLFPSLARRLQREAVRFTVFERKEALLDSPEGFAVTLEPEGLRGCNKVLITGSTLLNESLEEVLRYCRAADEVVLLGPTASGLPDPLFERGVQTVGGSAVVNLESLLTRMARGEPWGDAVKKYVIRRGDYPGAERLLGRRESPQARPLASPR